MNKSRLVARKQEIIAQKERIRRQLQHPKMQAQRRQQLNRQLEALMAEEYRLRQQIDRSRN